MAYAASGESPCAGREVAWIGVEVLKCPGGTCGYSRWQASSQAGIQGPSSGATYDFTGEPRLYAIRADGPAAGLLEEGDVLVAVNGFMITSPRGGRELALLEPGSAVDLLVRRQDRILELSVVAEVRCGPPIIATGEGSARPAPAGPNRRLPSGVDVSLPAPGTLPTVEEGGSGSLGLAVDCDGCGVSLGRGGEAAGSTSMTVQVRELFSDQQSLEVTGVQEGGAAWKAGLRPGDRLIRVNGIKVSNDEIISMFLEPRAGDELEVEFLRDGQPGRTTLVVERSLKLTRSSGVSSGGGYKVSGTSWGVGDTGLLLEFCPGCYWASEPDGSLVWKIDRPLAVVNVDSSSPAETAGLRVGDVITHVNGEPITSVEAGERYLEVSPGDWLELRFRRDGRVRTTTLKLPRN